LASLQHYGVYAFILNEARSHVLLIEKAIGPYKGLLDLPGGTPEDSETSEQTVVREVMEETGAEVDDLISEMTFDLIVDYTKEGRTHKLNHTGVVFQATLKTEILTEIKSSDTNGCLWLPLDEVNADKVALPTLTAFKSFL